MSAALSLTYADTIDGPKAERRDNVVVVDFRDAASPKSDIARSIAAEAEAVLAKEKRKGGIADLASGGRSDVYRVNPYLVNIKADFNCREMSDPANQDWVDELARSIAVNGVVDALTVFWEDGKMWVEDGHMRLLGTFRAIEVYGAEIKLIPARTTFKLVGKHMTMADRLATQHIRKGKPLSTFELGNNFFALLNAGWTTEQIARSAVLTPARVGQILALRRGATPEIKDLVQSGWVTPSFAFQALKEADGNSEKALQTLHKAVTIAKQAGRTKAMPKDAKEKRVKAVTAKLEVQPALALLPSVAMPITDITGSAIQHDLRGLLSRAKVDNRTGNIMLTLTAGDYSKLRALAGL